MRKVSLPFGIFVPNCTLKTYFFDLKVLKLERNKEGDYMCIPGEKSEL